MSDDLRGFVFHPGDDGYDDERAGFQTAAGHRPAVIVGATGADDVRAAVAFAAARDLPVGVQATGHGLAVRETTGGVLITTRRMTRVRVDAGARTAWIEAGARWEQVIEAAAQHGLAPLSGSFPGVGAIPYTLGGGLGLLSRRYGYAADRVRSIDVVTADGRLRHVTAQTEPDLFWALRGGRDNFGVVTGLEVDLVPVTRLYGGGLFFDGSLAVDVLDGYRRWTGTVPDEVSSSVGLIPMPDLPAVPQPLRGRHVVHVRVAYTGPAADGERLVEPLRAIGPRLIDKLGDMPYTAAGSIYNEPAQPHAYSGTNAFLAGLDEPAARTVWELAGPAAPVPCVVELRHLGGALATPPEVPNAVGHRDAAYLLRVLSPLDPDPTATHDRLFAALKSWTTGGRCLNFLYGKKTADQVREAYEPADYERLTRLKAGYDPADLFRLGDHIPPAR
jgi:FAD/FMN-containing dehydrogenase